jgi:hypothetical protein
MGSGNEYQRAKEMKSTTVFLLPLEYPKPYQINDALDVENANVAELNIGNWRLIMQCFFKRNGLCLHDE